MAQQRPRITHQSSSWCTTLNLFGTFVVHQIYHGGRHVQRACFWIFATAYFPFDGWPHCLKRPGPLRLPTCCVDALLLCFDRHYYQYYSAGTYKSFQPADCLLPPTTLHCDSIDFLPPWGRNGGSWVTQYKYLLQHQITGYWRPCLFFVCLFLESFYYIYFCETQWCI